MVAREKVMAVRDIFPVNSKVREFNDAFRQCSSARGKLLVTAGVNAKGPEFVVQAVRAVRAFSDFTEDNDPFGEHDFGSVEVREKRSSGKLTTTTRP